MDSPFLTGHRVQSIQHSQRKGTLLRGLDHPDHHHQQQQQQEQQASLSPSHVQVLWDKSTTPEVLNGAPPFRHPPLGLVTIFSPLVSLVNELFEGTSVIEGILSKYGDEDDDDDDDDGGDDAAAAAGAEGGGGRGGRSGEYKTMGSIKVKILGPKPQLHFLRHVSLAGKTPTPPTPMGSTSGR